MEKKELVSVIAKRVKIDMPHAELAVNEVIAQLVSPYILKKPGEQVGFLDNNCTNNCKEELAMREIKTSVGKT